MIAGRSEHMRIHMLGERPPRWTPEEKIRLLELRQAAMTLQECGTVLGRSYAGTRAQAAKLTKKTQSAPRVWHDEIAEAA